MIQMVRTNAPKIDRPLRKEILNIYKPFIKTPCIFHNMLEKSLQIFKRIPVVIEYENGCFEAGCQMTEKIMDGHMRNKMKQKFYSVSCASAYVTPRGLEELLNGCGDIKKIYLNRKVTALLDVAVPSAKAKNIVRDDTLLTGKGVKIAIIDTGIHPHSDLEGRITDFVDLVNGRTEPYDDNGHGTHCAGDAAGNGSASSGKYVGPAPEASLVGVKVLNKIGSGSLDTVMEGVEWCIEYNKNPQNTKIDIISMSLGSSAQDFGTDNDDPMVKIVEAAWNSGIIVYVAAGNEGPESGTIASPGVSDLVITVGALDDRDTPEARTDDDVASFSSRGPTVYGLTKPDILAPGVNIVSLRAPNSYLDKLQKTARVDNDYFVLSGTSMATPIAAGIGALMKQAYPNLSPNQIKHRLKSGCDMWVERDKNVYGSGYINAERAIP